MTWRDRLPELLSTGSFHTQDELARALEQLGHRVDQAAISRELRMRGAVKRDGAYHLAGGMRTVPVRELAVTGNGCLAVVRTDPAHAGPLAHAVDEARIAGVLGTIAGDDTVFVAMDGIGAAERLAAWLAISSPDYAGGRH